MGRTSDGIFKNSYSGLRTRSIRPQTYTRAWISKPEGGKRPLGIAILEDKTVQRAATKILNAIYEQDFLDCSYGFRDKRSAHDALRTLDLSIIREGVNYLLDVDFKGYFDNISITKDSWT